MLGATAGLADVDSDGGHGRKSAVSRAQTSDIRRGSVAPPPSAPAAPAGEERLERPERRGHEREQGVKDVVDDSHAKPLPALRAY